MGGFVVDERFDCFGVDVAPECFGVEMHEEEAQLRAEKGRDRPVRSVNDGSKQILA